MKIWHHMVFMLVLLLAGGIVAAPLQAQSGKPGSFNLISPAGGSTINISVPGFSWQAASGANRYQLQIRNSNGKIVKNKRYNPTQANCSGGGTCSVSSPYSFGSGNYTWRVVARNGKGATNTEYIALTVQLPRAEEILRLVNQKRCAAGRVPLTLNTNLNNAAQTHSNRMAQLNFFSHNDPQNGSTPFTRIAAAGYPGGYVGENIAAGYGTAQAAFTAWWKSSGHKRNIMDRSYRHMGLGYAYDAGSTYGHYWTQTFGTHSGATGGVCP